MFILIDSTAKVLAFALTADPGFNVPIGGAIVELKTLQQSDYDTVALAAASAATPSEVALDDRRKNFIVRIRPLTVQETASMQLDLAIANWPNLSAPQKDTVILNVLKTLTQLSKALPAARDR